MSMPREIPEKEFVAIQEIMKRSVAALRVLDLDNFITMIDKDPEMSKDIIMIRWAKLARAVRKLQYEVERLAVNKKEKGNGRKGSDTTERDTGKGDKA